MATAHLIVRRSGAATIRGRRSSDYPTTLEGLDKVLKQGRMERGD